MLIRKLLLISLFTGMSLLSLIAQTVTVHGTVTNSNGEGQDSVTIIIAAYFSDSTGFFETVFTNPEGNYSLEFPVDPLLFGELQVSMVDCWGTVVTQTFYIQNGADDFQVDFAYCDQIVFDSCVVYIIEEWVPGSVRGLSAWVPVNIPVDYLWSTGETTQSIYPLQDGLYCVTISYPDCEVSDCYEFVVDTFQQCFSYIFSTTNSDGTYNLEVVPYGTGPFTYAWNTSDSTNIIYNVGPGNYCATIFDDTGCSYETCFFIDDFTFCEVWISSDPANGSLIAYGYGQEPFSYLWSTGETTQAIYPYGFGTYCVTVTDANQCSASSCYYNGGFDTCYVYVTPIFTDSNTIALQAIGSVWNDSVTYVWNTGETGDIIYPEDLSQEYCVTMTSADGCEAAGCFENSYWCYAWVDVSYIDTSSAILTAFSDPIFGWGGNNTPTYLWSNGETTPTITVTESGTYCVTVTLDSTCVTEACGYVDFEGLQNSCSIWVVQYNDPATSQWYAQAWTWGFGTFEYIWSTGDTLSTIELDYPNQLACVTVTSSVGCETSACTDTFFNPCQVVIGIDYLDSLAVISAIAYYGGALINGTYSWSTGETTQSISVTEEGTYCVDFISDNGCQSSACVDIYFHNFDSCGVYIAEEFNPFGTQYTAYAGGTAPFSYLWSNGSTEQSQIIDFGLHDLCVTVTDAVGCISSACNFDTLDPVEGKNIINGFVYADSTYAYTGNVYLYDASANSGPFELIDSTRIVQGYYSFQNIVNGLYLVQAEVDGDYFPTYHWSSTSWEEANPVALPNWLPITNDIWMISTDTTNGTGVIGGVVTDPSNIVAAQDGEFRGGAGVPGVNVILSNAEGVAITYVVSLEDGSFRFTGLPFGTYRLSYDIPGIYSPDVWVTLTADEPERLNVSLVITEGSVDVEEPVATEVGIYPNPANEEIKIELPAGESTFDIQIVDMQGKVVHAGSARNLNGIMLIEVGQFTPGLYHINLRGEAKSYFGRFVKQE